MSQSILLGQGFVSSNSLIGFGRILVSQLLAFLAEDTTFLHSSPQKRYPRLVIKLGKPNNSEEDFETVMCS